MSQIFQAVIRAVMPRHVHLGATKTKDATTDKDARTDLVHTLGDIEQDHRDILHDRARNVKVVAEQVIRRVEERGH